MFCSLAALVQTSSALMFAEVSVLWMLVVPDYKMLFYLAGPQLDMGALGAPILCEYYED